MYVCCIMSYSEYFFPRIAFSSILGVVPKKFFLLPNMMATFVSFPDFKKMSEAFILCPVRFYQCCSNGAMNQWLEQYAQDRDNLCDLNDHGFLKLIFLRGGGRGGGAGLTFQKSPQFTKQFIMGASNFDTVGNINQYLTDPAN